MDFFLTDICNELLIISTNLLNCLVQRNINCNSFAPETAMKFDSFHQTFWDNCFASARCHFLTLRERAKRRRDRINDLYFM